MAHRLFAERSEGGLGAVPAKGFHETNCGGARLLLCSAAKKATSKTIKQLDRYLYLGIKNEKTGMHDRQS